MTWSKPKATGGSASGMPVAPNDGSSYVAMGDQWFSAVSVSSSSVYKWTDDTDATDPEVGRVKGNNSDEALITELYASETSLPNTSISPILAEAIPGDLIRVAQFGATGNYIICKVNGDPVDNGSWWSVPVEVLINGGGFTDNVDMALDYWPTGGRDAIVVASLDEAFTTASFDSNPQTKVFETISTSFRRAKITLSFEPRVTTSNRSIAVAIKINGVQFEREYQMEPKAQNNRPYVTKVFDFDFPASGDQDIEVIFGRRGGGGGSFVSLKSVRVIVEQLVNG